MISRSHFQTLAWSAAVVMALALCFALMLQVKGVKSDIAATERAMLSAQQEVMALETEFQTRARQQQLVRWNEVDFGYVAPRASQFYETRGELAMLGRPETMAAPAPVLLAEADEAPGSQDASSPGSPPRSLAVGPAQPPLTRIAAADIAPAASMRQLVANNRPVAASKPEPARRERSVPAPVKIAELPRMAQPDFAERFDLDSVIAGTRGTD